MTGTAHHRVLTFPPRQVPQLFPQLSTMVAAQIKSETSDISPKVLVIGIDPRSVPGANCELVETALRYGQSRFERFGILADLCLVGLDEKAESRITSWLEREPYACVVIGGGIRKPEPQLEFFERVINLVREHAPGATIGFNTNPSDSADAALRCLGLRTPRGRVAGERIGSNTGLRASGLHVSTELRRDTGDGSEG